MNRQAQPAQTTAGQCPAVHPDLGQCNALCDLGGNRHTGRHINAAGSWPQAKPLPPRRA